MSKIIKASSRTPVLGNDLLERWPGMSPDAFAEIIDAKNANDTDTEQDKKTIDFPNVYILVDDLLKNPETQIIHFKCKFCKPNYKKGEKYKQPYSSIGGRYDFSDLIFKLSEVKKYEYLYPEVFWERVEPNDTPLARNSKQRKDILKLKNKINKLENENNILKEKNEYLQNKLNILIPPSDDELIKVDVDKWQAYFESLDEKEKKGKKGFAARIAILKFSEKSHLDVYSSIFGSDTGKSYNTICRKISEYRKTAQIIVDEHGLTMPVWNTRNIRK